MTENSFAFRLKELLEHHKLTLQAVGTALGISRTAVHKWTRGGEIDYDNLRKLASFLKVNWIWLRYGEQAQQDLQSAANAQQLQHLLADKLSMYAVEMRFRCKDGHFIWANVKTSLQRNVQDGTPEHLVCVIEDASACRADRQAQEARIQELERMLEAAGQHAWVGLG